MAISLRPREGTQRQVYGAGPSYLKKAGIWNAQIIQQMNRLFAATGFVPKKDIRGIILNRWGHAFVTPQPGFFFDTATRTAPRNTVMKGYGRISFGHAELEGFQHWGPAADQGRRAMTQALKNG
jgi:spermidine dehydrogenase